MLFQPEEKKITIGSPEIGEVIVTSLGYLTVAENKFIEDYNKLLEPTKQKTLDYAKNIAKVLNEKIGDVTDSFYYNTTNSKEIRQKIIEKDEEGYTAIIKELQEITDKNTALRPYLILKFRTSDEVKEKIKEINPMDLLDQGKVLTKALLYELIYFFECETEGVEYTFERNRSAKKENFT